MGRVRTCLAVAMAFTMALSGWGPAIAGQEIPPDTVATIFVSDTIAGYGAVGGVAADSLGFVYVADFRNSVWRISPSGVVDRFATGLYGASGNAVGPKGELYQSNFNGNYVARISRAGAVEVYADKGLSGPVGLAASPNGDLFVVNCRGGTVGRIDTDRHVTEFAKSELFACPNGLTFDDRGDLYVVNFSNNIIVKVTPDGVATEFATVPGGSNSGHIAFARGSFYVTKFRANQIYRVSRDGSYSLLAGTGQEGEGDGPALAATFTRPNGIAATTGGKELWVNDLTVQVPAGARGPSVVTMRRIRLVTIADVLARLDLDQHADSVPAVYRAYHAARPDEDTVGEVVPLAYQWMSGSHVAAGIALMETNGELYPEHPAAQFHKGEAYRYTGQAERAAAQYRMVLELDPEFPQAAERLAQVTGGSPLEGVQAVGASASGTSKGGATQGGATWGGATWGGMLP